VKETELQRVPELYKGARDAFNSWSQTPLVERINYLRRLRLHIVDHLDELVDVISNDTGKVRVEALTADILTTLDSIGYIEKNAHRVLKKKRMPTPLLLVGKRSYIEYKPRGVVLVISPWNFPFQLSMIPVASAIVGGNTVILKPSEVTPAVGRVMEKIFKGAGLPFGVIQVVHGGKELGEALVKGTPNYIFFTGSVKTGKAIQAEAAKDLIPTTLELGGKDPMIVFADAPMDRAVQGAIWGAFNNAGQVCMSVERLYVQESIYADFLQRLVDEVGKLRLGSGEQDDIGSMASSAQVDIVRSHVEDALSKGAKLLTGQTPDKWEGLFIPPMVMVDVTWDMKILQEETFGPLLPVIPFHDEDEVIAWANDSPYGLNASIWCRDTQRARRVASRLISGGVVINDIMITIANSHLPFGGEKLSGIGRYHGDVGLRTFCHETSVMVDKGRCEREVNWFPYRGKFLLFHDLIRSYFGKRVDWYRFIRAYMGLLKK
jgi:acyl-CoA reductase-like NAD-dependent aldehyde dehydrogenase